MGKFKEIAIEQQSLFDDSEYMKHIVKELQEERDEYLADLITLLFMIKNESASIDHPFIKTLDKKLKKSPKVNY